MCLCGRLEQKIAAGGLSCPALCTELGAVCVAAVKQRPVAPSGPSYLVGRTEGPAQRVPDCRRVTNLRRRLGTSLCRTQVS